MKPIKITEQLKNQLFEKFKSYMTEERFTETDITFKADIKDAIPEKVKKPIIYCTPIANVKIRQLVMDTDSEIAWHGVVTKHENIYYIEDILMYPQHVTGATVTTEDESYAKWLMSVEDDTFNKIRMQGHSHVKMGVTPSTVDTTYYKTLLQNLSEGDYYIFMIVNQKGEQNIWLYDFEQNIIFEKEDITFGTLIEPATTVKKWADAEKEQHIIKPKIHVAQKTDPGYYNPRDYTGYQYYGQRDAFYASENLEKTGGSKYGYNRGKR